MTILILTSASHIYANIILSRLIKRGVFSGHQVYVFEQDLIVPGKTKIQGLRKYITISGWNYVLVQIAKQGMFRFRQTIDLIFHRIDSVYYPYQQFADASWDIRVQNRIGSDEVYGRIRAMKPDLILSVYSKEIIPDRVLRIPRLGAINIHPAYLPLYRGVSPVFWAMARGEKYVGVTVHTLDVGIDTGAILSHKKMAAAGYSTEHRLYMQLSVVGAGLLESTVNRLLAGRGKIAVLKNDPKKGQYFSLPTKDAVKTFFQRGNRFFRLSEFVSFMH